MPILALDASTEACSVALSCNDRIPFLFEIAPQQHTHIILPMIKTLLDTHAAHIAECRAIAFGQGPGSFTGLRIAAGVAQGLSIAHHLPLIAISSLASLALAAKNASQPVQYYLAALDARMGEVYYALYTFQGETITTIIDDDVASPQQAAQLVNQQIQNQTWIGIGSGIPLLEEYIQSEATTLLPAALPCAREVAILAEKAYARGESIATHQALPHYLRNDVVHKK